MNIFRKMLCFIGHHEWSFSSVDFEEESWKEAINSAKPPWFARCCHCNLRYKDKPKNNEVN